MVKFSVVTISCNQGDYLGKLLDSICVQKTDDVEYIVQDPGSTDGSLEILRRRQRACIDHLLLEPDDGPSDGLNRGFAHATGEIGYFINSDDLLLPGAVAMMRALWSEHADVDVILGCGWMIDGDGKPLRRLRSSRLVSLEDFLCGRASLVQQGMSFRMDLFREVGGFNPANRTCWDAELLYRMLAAGARVVAVPNAIGAFRMSGENLSSGVGGARHHERYLADKARIYRELAGREPRDGTLQVLFNRLVKHVANPYRTFGELSDRVIPGRMMRRWRKDVAT